MVHSIEELHLNQPVLLQDGRRAVVRYTGDTRFSAGAWVGLELEGPTGKNDGAVQGVRYFQCERDHGVFVRPSVLSMVERETASSSSSSNGAGNERPRGSVTAGPSTAASMGTAASRLRRPRTQSPPKPLPPSTSTGSSASAAPRTGPPPSRSVQARPRTLTRPSTVLPTANTTRASRSSVTSIGAASQSGTLVNTTTLVRTRPPFRSGIAVPQHSRTPSSGSNASGSSRENGNRPTQRRPSQPRPSPPTSDTPDGASPNATSPLPSLPLPSLDPAVAELPTPIEPPSSREVELAMVPEESSIPVSPSNKEVEELKAKLRVVEQKRLEDRDKLRSLEKVQAERNRFEAIIRKLEAKFQPQHQELARLRKQLKDAETKLQQIETEQGDHDNMVEMVTMDRELAEQNSELYKTQLDALKVKTEELELEVEILKEEKELLAEGLAPEDRASESRLQLERSNEKLKEALIRLRDMTQTQEATLKTQVLSLEGEVRSLTEAKNQIDTTKAKLAQAESTIEDLRQQLETALGAEEVIEELTHENMTLREQIQELRANLEDLIALKDVNDEIEAAHIAAEKQMQLEIDHRDTLLAEQNQRITQMDDALKEHLHKNARYHELVAQLQHELDTMRASQQLTETEAKEVDNRSRAMLDLSRTLQTSASKAQANTIDLELARLEAQQASEHLAIVQSFLPKTIQAEQQPILALLRFRRVLFKAHLLHGLVKERVGGKIIPGRDDDIFAGCDVLEKLTWTSAMCDRFIWGISTSPLEELSTFENALYELEPVERALTGWIDGVRRDELDMKQVAAQLQGSIALMSHLAELVLADRLESYPPDVRMHVLLTQSALETTSMAMTRLKDMVQSKVSTMEDDADMAQDFVNKIGLIVTNSRSANMIISKVLRALEDLDAKSLSLSPETVPLLQFCEDISKASAKCARDLGQDLFVAFNEEGLKERLTYKDIAAIVSATTASGFDGQKEGFFETMIPSLSILVTKLGEINNLTSNFSQLVAFKRSPSPWTLRARELETAEDIPKEMEERIATLKLALSDSATQLKLRDQTLEESSMRIEVLEARMRDATSKTERIAELERHLTDTKHREEELSMTVEKQYRELQTIEAEKEQWRKTVETLGPRDTQSDLSDHASSATSQSLSTELEQQILRLYSSVRYYREDNQYYSESWSIFAWLHATVSRPVTTREELRANLLAREAQDILQELLRLVTDDASSVFDMHDTPSNHLAWKPAKATPQWRVRRQFENWESLSDWSEDLLMMTKEMAAYRLSLPQPNGNRSGGEGGLTVDGSVIGVQMVEDDGVEVIHSGVIELKEA